MNPASHPASPPVERPRASVLLPVYNNYDVVAPTLYGLAGQDETAFEVVFCDDGSEPTLRTRLVALCHRLHLANAYAYHRVVGFQKTIVLNKGVLLARSDYLVFLDGDCIPHRGFVRAHLRSRRPGAYCAGRRVMLNAAITRRIQVDPSRGRHLAAWRVMGRCRRFEEGWRLPAFLRERISVRRILGCNWSCWKADLVGINGFNNESLGRAGGEDKDISLRFERLGLVRRSVRFDAVVFHQDHGRSAAAAGPVHRVHHGEICRVICRDGLATLSVDDPTG